MTTDNMIERYRLYSKKTAAWPDAAQYYLGSDSLSSNQKRLAEMYGIDDGELAELLIDLINADFDFSRLADLAQSRLGILPPKTGAFCDDFIIYILLPLGPHYPELKIRQEAESRNIDIAKYQPFTDAFNGELENEALDVLDLAVDSFSQIDPKEEADAVMGVIKNSLADMLKNATRDTVEHLNNSLLFIFNDDLKNRDKVLQLLMTDKTRLTEKSLLIHDKPEDPTIANWLADFLFRAQNKIADSLVLTEYMTGSVNCRRLDAKERQAVQNLFTFYRNLKLFPKVFSDSEPQNWQIFPMPEDAAQKPAAKKNNAINSAPSAGENAEIANFSVGKQTVAEKLKNYDWSSISGFERRALLEELGVSKKDLDDYINSVR